MTSPKAMCISSSGHSQEWWRSGYTSLVVPLHQFYSTPTALTWSSFLCSLRRPRCYCWQWWPTPPTTSPRVPPLSAGTVQPEGLLPWPQGRGAVLSSHCPVQSRAPPQRSHRYLSSARRWQERSRYRTGWTISTSSMSRMASWTSSLCMCVCMYTIAIHALAVRSIYSSISTIQLCFPSLPVQMVQSLHMHYALGQAHATMPYIRLLTECSHLCT